MLGIVIISVWIVAVEGRGSSLAWFLDWYEPNAGLSMSLPLSRDDPEHVPAFRQCRGFSLSPVDGARRVAGAHKLYSKEESLASTGFHLYLLQKDGEDPYLPHSLHTHCATSPSSIASWALLGSWTQLFHHPPSFNISGSLGNRGGQEITLDLQSRRLVWVALAPALKGFF